VAFDDDRLVADAGLLLPATLTEHLGLKELVERHLDLGGCRRSGDLKLAVGLNHLPSGKFAADGSVAGGAVDGPL
jgi:hypothetical protein